MRLLMSLLVLPLMAPQEVKQSPYYPLKVGTKWEYKVGDTTIVVSVAKHEKVGDVMCALLETSRDGQVIAKEHIAATEDGVNRYSYGGVDCDPPVRILKLPVKKGESWKVESAVGKETLKGTFLSGEAEVEVPAGKYKAVTSEAKDLEAGSQIISTTYYFAEGVGIVKQYVKVGEQEIVIELSKFTEGK